MRIKIQKWGNSLAVRLPNAFVKEAHLAYGTQAEITVDDGKIVIEGRQDPVYTLDELLKGINPGNLHEEVDMGEAKGREAW